MEDAEEENMAEVVVEDFEISTLSWAAWTPREWQSRPGRSPSLQTRSSVLVPFNRRHITIFQSQNNAMILSLKQCHHFKCVPNRPTTFWSYGMRRDNGTRIWHLSTSVAPLSCLIIKAKNSSHSIVPLPSLCSKRETQIKGSTIFFTGLVW